MTACCFHGRRWTLCRTDWRSLRGAVTVATGSVLRASEAPRPPALRLTPALSEHRTGSSGVQAPHAAPRGPRPSPHCTSSPELGDPCAAQSGRARSPLPSGCSSWAPRPRPPSTAFSRLEAEDGRSRVPPADLSEGRS